MSYIKHLLHGLICAMLAVPAYGISNTTTVADKQKIATLLERGKVIKQEAMGMVLDRQGKKKDFASQVFLVTLDNGLKAVFKPVWMGSACAEVAAYQASLKLDFPNIPPTIIRTIDGKKGSLQLFIETAIDPLAPGVYDQAIAAVDPEALANLQIFYFVFGHCDVCKGNVLITKDQGKTALIAIDNESIRYMQHAQYGSLPFTRRTGSKQLHTDDWHKPFPFDAAIEVKDNPSMVLKERFGALFSESFYRSITKCKPLRYVIYQNAIWIQDGRYAVWECPKYCAEKTKNALKQLNITTLKEIFAAAIAEKEVGFVTNRYLNAILERRDQVLNHYAKG